LAEKQAEEAKYRFCLFNKELEKVSNSLVEPPGIFRGRGEHPHAGSLKSRIIPEMVTINTGLDDPIPKCPVAGHCWEAIVENKEAAWLATFKDERASYAPRKYINLAADSKIKGENDKKKYEKARRLKEKIKTIRANYTAAMESSSVTDNQLGVCTYLIDKLALRVGNEKGEDEADTVGCCSLRVEHIHLEDGSKVTFDFLGKDSMRYYNTVEVLPIVHRRLSEFVQGKEPSDDIFDKINASRLNEYLKESMEDLSAKVFRTYNASITLQQELTGGQIDAEKDTVDAKLKFYNDCNRKVALLCNHQKSVSKNHDEQMAKMNESIDEIKEKLARSEQLRKLYKQGKEPTGKLKEFADEKNNPKNLEQAEKVVAKLREKLDKKEMLAKAKEDNKAVALGTSRINYMDPRITISWCKRKEVPIEKIFTPVLRSKFAWAMSNEPGWNF